MKHLPPTPLSLSTETCDQKWRKAEALETDSVIDTTESITQGEKKNKKVLGATDVFNLKKQKNKKKKLLTQMIQGSKTLTEGKFREKKRMTAPDQNFKAGLWR